MPPPGSVATGGLTTNVCDDVVDRAFCSHARVTDHGGFATLVAIPRTVERAAGDLVHRAFEQFLSSDVEVMTATQAKRLLADYEDTEQMTDAIQRFLAIATPVARIALRGARFTRVPWVLVASSAVSIGVTVRNGVRELQAIAALLTHRFEQETESPPDPALLRKLTLELYLKPRHAPDVSDLGLPLARLARRWIVSGALGRNTRKKTEKALDAAERLDVCRRSPRGRLDNSGCRRAFSPRHGFARARLSTIGMLRSRRARSSSASAFARFTLRSANLTRCAVTPTTGLGVSFGCSGCAA